MDSRELLFIACLGLFGGLTSTTTTTTFVSAMSTVNSDIERFLRLTNVSQTRPTVEERIAVDTYVLAYLNYTYKDKNGELIEFAEEKGRYGEGRVLNVNGPLVHVTSASNADDDTACSENILGTLRKAIPTTKWIALVRRGGCTFEEKVRHVWQKGAAGVIIYNDKAVPNLEKMQITDKTRNITAVITYQYIGQEMARSVDEGYEVIASITEGRSGMRPINTLNKTSVLFVSISFIIMMIISLVWLIFYYIQRFRYLQTKDQQSRHLCTVTKRAIMKIPTKTGVRCDEKDADNDCCPICIEAYKSTDCIRVLPCKHEFHKICIDPWLLEHRTCPMCKLDVLKFYGYVYFGSEESIMELQSSNASRNNSPNPIPLNGVVNIPSNTTAGGGGNGGPSSILTDLIRSREFVIEFPRILTLDMSPGSSNNPAERSRRDYFNRLPERSQSSLSFVSPKDWSLSIPDKLTKEQIMPMHSLAIVRNVVKQKPPYDRMQEQTANMIKKRRSHSADGRYSHGYFARKELSGQENRHQQNSTAAATAAAACENRTNNVDNKNMYKNFSTKITITDFLKEGYIGTPERQATATDRADPLPPPDSTDFPIQIQINGEGIEF